MLSEERIRELRGQLQGLSPEEQQAKLQELLTPEELKEIQQQQCPFCLIKEGKIEAIKIYEDDFFIAVLDINPAAKGHVVLFPKEHISFLALMDDTLVGQMFILANRISKAVYDGLKAEGTNIFVANGQIAGQNVDHVIVHIIPRYKDDKVNFGWESLKISNEELKEIANKILLPKEEEKIVEEPKVEEEDIDIEERIP